jgi:hypothetical protein
MKKSILYLLVFTVSFLSSCGNESIDEKTSTPNYQSVKFDLTTTENEEVAYFEISNTSFPIHLIFFKESGNTFIEVNNNTLLVDLETRSGDGFSTKKGQLALFKNKVGYILMFPTFTEEFPDFQLLGLSKNGEFSNYGWHTYSYDAVEKMNKKFTEVDYKIKERNDTLRVYLKQDNDVLLSELHFHSDKKVKLTLDEEKMLESLLEY